MNLYYQTFKDTAPKRIPSVKTLSRIDKWQHGGGKITTEQAKAIRTVLQKATDGYQALCMVDQLLDSHGVESILAGSNKKSPHLDYVNLGETYDVTLILVDRRYWAVCGWGDLVENGSCE